MTATYGGDIAGRTFSIQFGTWDGPFYEACALCPAALSIGRIQVVLDGPPIVAQGYPASLVCRDCLRRVAPSLAHAVRWLDDAIRLAARTGMGWDAAVLNLRALRADDEYLALVRATLEDSAPCSDFKVWSYLQEHPCELAAELRLRADQAERHFHQHDPTEERYLRTVSVVLLLLRELGPMTWSDLVDMLRDEYGVPTDPAASAIDSAVMAGTVTPGETPHTYKLTDRAYHPAATRSEIG